MADAEAQAMSKSAKRRAAKKARDAAHAEEEVKPVAKPEPKPKAQPKAAEPAPKAKAKAKAEPKAEAKATPAAPKAAPKAEAKKEPESKPAAKQAAAPAAKSAGAKSKAQPKAKAKAKQEEEEEKKPAKEEFGPPVILDDGTGGDWEVSSGLSKKQQKQQERKKEQELLKKQIHDSSGVGGKQIPGMAPPGAQNTIPGMKPADARAAADKKALAKVAADASAIQSGIVGQNDTTETAPKADAATATIQVPESKIGIVIGPKGSKIKMIQEKTGVTRIDTTGEVFTITGNTEAVAAAESAIRELIEKGFTSLSFEDFAENFVMVHPSSFPDLIGKGGCVVQALKKELQVEVNFPETPKNAPASKKFKVTIAGAKANVDKAKEVIHNIQMYYHDEITHPDQVHVELDCAEWLWRFLIGKGGSEMRHIQNNYKVRVYIPRETSMNTKVVVVGEQRDVDRAKTYIDKILWNAEHAPRGRDRGEGGADDGWGEEEEEEEWMQQYMVKRR